MSNRPLPTPAADPRRAVLLAATTDLRSNSIGSLFLRDVMASAPGIAFALHQEPPFLMGGGAARWGKVATVLRAAAARAPSLQSARLAWFRTRRLPDRAAAIAAAADRAGAECIWLTASSPEMIWIGERLAASGRDVRVTVWDAPEYLAGNLRLPDCIRQALLQAFGNLLRQARSVSVIGRAMQDDYARRYGVRSEIIRHGVGTATLPAPSARPAGDELRIVFAGSLYSKEEWNSFTQALEEAGWTVGGRKVALHFMGRFPLTGARKPDEVVLLGEKPFAEALQLLSTMDIGYLPYWFDPRHEVAARTSFPGKLSAYAAAGLAVFHHAPPYTEATAFLAANPFGVACPSLEAREVIGTLGRLVETMDSDACRQARETALREELSQEAMAARFGRFLARRPA